MEKYPHKRLEEAAKKSIQHQYNCKGEYPCTKHMYCEMCEGHNTPYDCCECGAGDFKGGKEMTNQEKIDELVPIITANGKFSPMCLMSNYQCRSKVRQMAEWKDHQFKEYLEKKYDTALNAWDDWAAYDPKTAESWRIKTRYIREIINELFGK